MNGVRFALAPIGLFAIAAGACGDNVPMFQSGIRLTAIVDVGGEGAEAIAYYEDATGFACAFAPDATGTSRCFPRAELAPIGFVDPDCLIPVYTCPACTGDVASLREAGCDGTVVRPVAVTAHSPPSFIRAGRACVRAVLPPGPYYRATPADPSLFVAAAFRDVPVTEHLGTRMLVTDDGVHEHFHAAFERDDGRPCTFFGGTSGRCLPGTPALAEVGDALFFADDTCTTRVAAAGTGCAAPTHVRFEGAIHALTPMTAPAFERSPVDSSCFATGRTDLAFFAIGAVDGTLPTANIITLGTGEARPVYYADRGHPLAFANRWVDVDGMTCTPLATVDGRRCIGRSHAVVPADVRYGDAGCTLELVPNPRSDLYALRWEDEAVTGESRVETIHALHAYPATEMYERQGDACVLSAEPAVLMAFVGPPLDPRAFPSVDRRSAP